MNNLFMMEESGQRGEGNLAQGRRRACCGNCKPGEEEAPITEVAKNKIWREKASQLSHSLFAPLINRELR